MDDSGQLEKLDETEENPQHLCVRTKRLERGKDFTADSTLLQLLGQGNLSGLINTHPKERVKGKRQELILIMSPSGRGKETGCYDL